MCTAKAVAESCAVTPPASSTEGCSNCHWANCHFHFFNIDFPEMPKSSYNWERFLWVTPGSCGLSPDLLSPKVILYNAALSACEKALQWQAAVVVLQNLRELGQPSVVSFNTALSACGKAKRWQRALDLFADIFAINLEGKVGDPVKICIFWE